MRGSIAPLSRFEGAALRKVGFGSDDVLAPEHVRRLIQLNLIQWNGLRWVLTPIGRERYDLLVNQNSQKSS